MGCFVQAYASVQLNVDLNFSDSVYGLGSGIFFLGYMVFQVSLNYLLPAVLAAKLVLEDLMLCSQRVLRRRAYNGEVDCVDDLQIPSQLMAERVGTNRWIGFLTLGWGIVATCMAGLTSNPTHLYILRFLLGAFWQLATEILFYLLRSSGPHSRHPQTVRVATLQSTMPNADLNGVC